VQQNSKLSEFCSELLFHLLHDRKGCNLLTAYEPIASNISVVISILCVLLNNPVFPAQSMGVSRFSEYTKIVSLLWRCDVVSQK
jgi:hypothetical protein